MECSQDRWNENSALGVFPVELQLHCMYDEILVPTDGSDPSLIAVDQGIEIAEEFGGRVHFLHVVDVGTEMSAGGVGTIADELTETLEEVAEEALDEAESRVEDAGISYERAVLEGTPHEAIDEYSTEHDIDVIIIGTSGHSGIKENLLGSTTDRVAKSVNSSVLIARS